MMQNIFILFLYCLTNQNGYIYTQQKQSIEKVNQNDKFKDLISGLLSNNTEDINYILGLNEDCEELKILRRVSENFFDEAQNNTLSLALTPKFACLKTALPAIISILLQKLKININSKNKNLETPLHIAVKHQDLNIIKLLVSSLAEVNAIDEFGNTPLHNAARYNPSVISYLIEKKAIISISNRYNWTALHYAAEFNNDALIILLKEITKIKKFSPKEIHSGNIDTTVNIEDASVNLINAINNEINTPLHLAAKKNVESVKELLNNQANPNLQNIFGNTPLHNAIQDIEIVKELLKHNADINIKNKRNLSFLELAIIENSEAVKEILKLNQEKKITIKDKNLIHFALEHNPNAIEILVTDLALSIDEKYNGYTALHKAIKDNLETIKLLLKSQANPEIKSDENFTALQLAAMHNAPAITILLNPANFGLEIRPANIESLSKDNQTALHIAIINKNLEAVKELLKFNANINAQDINGDTPLHLAVNHSKEILNALLNPTQYGLLITPADLNIQNNDGNTPLHIAAKKTTSDALKLLIKFGANLDLKNKEGYLPIHLAAKHSDKALDVFLNPVGHNFKLKFNLESVTKDGETPLLIAARFDSYNMSLLIPKVNISATTPLGDTILHVAAKYNIKSLTYLLNIVDKKMIYKMNYDGITPLHNAAQNDTQALDLFNNLDADWEIKTKKGLTPLHFAIKSSKLDCFKKLLQLKANVHARTIKKLTALHYASKYLPEAIILLNQTDAQFHVKDETGQAPKHYAAKYNPNALKILLELNNFTEVLDNDNSTLAHYAARFNIDSLKLLLNYKANVNAQNKFGITPLHLAIKYLPAAAKLLVNNYANPNVEDFDTQSPLHYAAQFDPGIIELLLDNDSNLEGKNKSLETPLHIAAQSNFKSLLKLLNYKSKPNIEAKTIEEKKPLHYAAKNSYESVKALVKQGADMNAKSMDTFTPLDIAIACKKNNTIAFLLKNKAIVNESNLLNLLDADNLQTLYLLNESKQCSKLNEIFPKNLKCYNIENIFFLLKTLIKNKPKPDKLEYIEKLIKDEIDDQTMAMAISNSSIFDKYNINTLQTAYQTIGSVRDINPSIFKSIKDFIRVGTNLNIFNLARKRVIDYALKYASLYKNKDLIGLFLSYGAKIDAKSLKKIVKKIDPKESGIKIHNSKELLRFLVNFAYDKTQGNQTTLNDNKASLLSILKTFKI